MALVPFSHVNPFTDQLRLPERLFTINGRIIKIKQGWKPGGKGGTAIGFGASVYQAAYVMAEYLERHPHLVRGKRVIELGTGTGFLGIAAAVLGAARVCLTDGDAESVQLARANVARNLPATSAPSGARISQFGGVNGSMEEHVHHAPGVVGDAEFGADTGSDGAENAAITVKRLLWGNAADIEEAGGPWDVILGTDIAALPYASCHRDLLQTIRSLANYRSNRRGVNAGRDGKLTRSAERENAGPTSESSGMDAEGTSLGPSQAVVLIAHKRRHVSEDAFFDEAGRQLGGGSIELGQEEIHPDFRDTGIRLYMYHVDLRISNGP